VPRRPRPSTALPRSTVLSVKEMRKHLLGIKEQNYFLMKTRTAA
jgi:hypothetical protein